MYSDTRGLSTRSCTPCIPSEKASRYELQSFPRDPSSRHSQSRVASSNHTIVLAYNQIVDNYGQHYALLPKADRQQKLLKQYYFICDCIPCRENWPVYHQLRSFKVSNSIKYRVYIYLNPNLSCIVINIDNFVSLDFSLSDDVAISRPRRECRI